MRRVGLESSFAAISDTWAHATAADIGRGVDGDVDESESRPSLSAWPASPVELPGIELGTEMRATCGNVELDDAKRRESTPNYLRIRGRC